MHIHGSMQNIQGANLTSISGAERAAAAQRAADVRKRLLKNAQTLDGDTTPEETLLIGQWLDSRGLDSRHSQVLSGDEYHSAAEGKDSDFG